jgi:hypothetical protein
MADLPLRIELPNLKFVRRGGLSLLGIGVIYLAGTLAVGASLGILSRLQAVPVLLQVTYLFMLASSTLFVVLSFWVFFWEIPAAFILEEGSLVVVRRRIVAPTETISRYGWGQACLDATAKPVRGQVRLVFDSDLPFHLLSRKPTRNMWVPVSAVERIKPALRP